jgi:putative transposase
MNTTEWERHSDDLALARYAVISPLVSRQLSTLEHNLVRTEILRSVHLFPDRARMVSRRALDRWCQWYREGHLNDDGEVLTDPGIDALKPIARDDRGKPRKLDPATIDRAVELRREVASRTTSALIELLKGEALLAGREEPSICETTLAYHLRQRKATKKDLKREGKAYRRYEHPHRNSNWQGDFSQGILIPDPQNPKKTRLCHLHAFIDDHSRYIVHAEFYLRQDLPCLEDCFRKAILKGGIPSRVYWDNGAVYKSRQIQIVAARLATQVIFATPYCPEGKGKVERWFRSVKDAFYPEAKHADIRTLAELNEFFWAWLERVYHARIHSETKETPLARWEAGSVNVRFPAPAQLVDLFLWEAKRRVDKSGCIQLSGNLYSVAEHLVGQEVTVRFDPFDLTRVRLYEGGSFSQTLEPQTLVSRTFRKAQRKEEEKAGPLESSGQYRKIISERHRDQAQNVQARLRGPHGSCLTESQFLTLLTDSLGCARQLTAVESTLVREFFPRNAPLGGAQVEAALAKAIAAKGPSLHLRYYLEAIKASRSEGQVS